ncbi:leucine-rich repeat-containing protein 74A-like [Engraulis encrasicolus]|uniref:leucine-rich repeat-containing protein 74A-like n=1 Tax=Engraulis encrasicolus TaxID=184585 RepID=UPI002FCFC84D
MAGLEDQSISVAGMTLRDVMSGTEPEESGDELLPGGQQPDSGDEWDTDLEVDDFRKRRLVVTATDLYLQACQIVGVIPATYYLRHLDQPTLNMNHHGLGPKGTKALAIALVSDINITDLELEDNGILAEGVGYLAEMMKENFYIQRMNLSYNNLQTDGAENVAKMLMEDTAIKVLKLSGNGFVDEASKYFADALATHFQVKSLDLSHNQFCENEHLGHMLASNESLETLNLSWNFLRMGGAVALCNGLKVNVTLKHLDLSHNGFGNEGAQAVGDALRHNNTLLSLDLSSNRITDQALRLLCHGLAVNDSLRVLRLLQNPITSGGTLLLLTTIRNNPKSGLEVLDISTLVVSEAFVELLESVRQDHPALEVHYQGVAGYFSRGRKLDPIQTLQKILAERTQSLADFFRKIDKDGSMRVHASDLKKAIQQEKIPLDCYSIEVLIQKLGADKAGMIDYSSQS